jgi:hypothetical protein
MTATVIIPDDSMTTVAPSPKAVNNVYVEPTYPLTKTEQFCEDTMKFILNDEDFSVADRKRLSLYNKHKIGAGRVNVTYRLGLGCEEKKIGRLYADDSLGISAFSRIIRNPLMAKRYWDLDIENCHYRIAEQYAVDHNLKHDKISEYCNNRNEILKMTSNSRSKAKTELLKVLYGGNIKLYDESYTEQEGEISNEGNKFLAELSVEVKVIANNIWATNEHLHKFKPVAKGSVAINKKPNPKASLMSLIFQSREREILMKLDWHLNLAGRPYCVLIHDGGYIQKLPNETIEMFESWLESVYDGLVSDIPESVSLVVKPIEHDWKPTVKQMSPYERIRMDFEKTHAIVGGTLLHIYEDGTTEQTKLHSSDPRFLHLNWTEYIGEDKPVKKYFMKEWLEDANVKRYDKQDFIPDVSKCPKNVFNLFDGFEAGKIDYENLTDEQIEELVRPIIDHMNLLTTGNGNWLASYLANIIQTPHLRSQICPLIRDEGGLIVNGGGTGKTTFFEWVMSTIIGSKYCFSVANNSDVYGAFNGQFEGKLLIVLEEASGDSNFKNNDLLKAKLTQKKQFINKKGIQGYEVNDYSRWIACTNNRNPFLINAASRRFAVMDANPEKRGYDKYFTDLFAHLDKIEVKVAFYRYLKNLKEVPRSPVEWFNAIPNTAALREVMYMNSPPMVKWLIHMVKNGTFADDYVGTLYEQFRAFVKQKREGKEETMMTECAFGILLNKNKETGAIDLGDKHKTAQGQKFSWNVSSIVKHLQIQQLIDYDFEYKDNC